MIWVRAINDMRTTISRLVISSVQFPLLLTGREKIYYGIYCNENECQSTVSIFHEIPQSISEFRLVNGLPTFSLFRCLNYLYLFRC
jgi:hypothetical protein